MRKARIHSYTRIIPKLSSTIVYFYDNSKTFIVILIILEQLLLCFKIVFNDIHRV